jgi:hypothetical protein
VNFRQALRHGLLVADERVASCHSVRGMKPDFGLVQGSGKLPADETLEGHCDRQQKTRQAKKRAGSERGFEAVKWCREPESNLALKAACTLYFAKCASKSTNKSTNKKESWSESAERNRPANTYMPHLRPGVSLKKRYISVAYPPLS